MQRSIFLLSFTVLFILPLISATGNGRTFIGGWRLIRDLTDPHLIEIAEFAVAQHNSLAHAQLKFEKLLKAERKTVEGVDYRVRISALDGTVKREYVAVVWERVWLKVIKLVSFNKP
ncbi:hypothetical protein Drorol1_Dr00005490 [Drosera rotundifolia]